MDKINNFLDHVYGSNQSLLYFYIALGAISLFFIILVLIALLSGENRREKKYQKLKAIEAEYEIDDEPDPEDDLSETQVFNNILMGKREYNEKIDIQNSDELENVNQVNQTKNVLFEEKPVEESVSKAADVYLEKEEVKEEPLTVPVYEDKVQIEDDKEVLKDAVIDNFNVSSDDDYTTEMPKVKPMDIDDYLFRKETVVKEETHDANEPVKEETTKKVEFSNDELKNRLAMLKAKKEHIEDEIPDTDLENLMKAVGLEDTTIIPEIHNEEDTILGR